MRDELYQQTILEHNKNPRNFKKLEGATHVAEGYNPLCGDHLWIYMNVKDNVIQELAFEGSGCAISKASASMMTTALKGKTVEEAKVLFNEFHELVIGNLKPDQQPNHHLGKLAVFSGIWQYPSRVKCASLGWHTVNGALNKKTTVSTE